MNSSVFCTNMPSKMKVVVLWATARYLLLVKKKLLENESLFKRRKRREYVAELNLNRNERSMATYLDELSDTRLTKQSTMTKRKNFFRMSVDEFTVLLRMVEEKIRHPLTHRLPVMPKTRLAITLRFLNGDSPSLLGHAFKLHRGTVSGIVYETLDKLYSILQPVYLKKPTEVKWREIASKFWTRWNYPLCLGAIDGKHVAIRKPPNSSSTFFNRKEFFSVVMMAVVDAEYNCVYLDYGASGRNSDAGLYNVSDLAKSIKAGTANFPGLGMLPGTSIDLNFHLIGDEGFPMSTRLLRPYPGRQSGLIFPICADPEKVDKIIRTSVVLHNYLMKNSNSYRDLQNVDLGCISTTPMLNCDTPPPSLQTFGGNYYRSDAQQMRNKLKEYFMSDMGKTEFQMEAIKNQ